MTVQGTYDNNSKKRKISKKSEANSRWTRYRPNSIISQAQKMARLFKKRKINNNNNNVPAHHRINLKESEKKDKYLDLARELKKLWNMKVTIVPIVIGALGTVTKGLLKGLEDLEVGGWVETIQMTALLRTARILRRVLKTCCHWNSSEKPSANTDVKNSRGVNNNNNLDQINKLYIHKEWGT